MNSATNTVLITGGASGIGLALAERFLQAGSQVIVCGRRADKLQEVKERHPQIRTRVCDVAQASERVALLNWVKQEAPDVNVLINNAGIQRRMSLVNNEDSWEEHRQEIAINVDAPIHLSILFIPHLLEKDQPAIVNVSSGLAFAPAAFAPIYSATKAAVHSFTQSLRHQVRDTPIRVIEIVPPAVNTDLGGAGLHTWGLHDFADAMMQGLQSGAMEIGYGTSETNRNASRTELDEIFVRMNSRY